MCMHLMSSFYVLFFAMVRVIVAPSFLPVVFVIIVVAAVVVVVAAAAMVVTAMMALAF